MDQNPEHDDEQRSGHDRRSLADRRRSANRVIERNARRYGLRMDRRRRERRAVRPTAAGGPIRRLLGAPRADD